MGFELTDENYYSQEANLAYMSCSQWKSFRKCEEAALAELAGDYQREVSTAMLIGSYVDSYYEGTLDKFKEQHPEIFKKDGSLKVDFAKCEEIIERTTKDKLFSKYMSGEKQVIMTGEIAGVPFKIKMDSYHPGKAIVDLKCMKDFAKVWDSESRAYVPFVESWGYDFQGAIYQEIVRQNTGEQLPFFIAAATKEKIVDIAVMSIPQDRLDYCLKIVEETAPRFNQLKLGELDPGEACRCGKCDWCKQTKVLTEIVDYRDLDIVI